MGETTLTMFYGCLRVFVYAELLMAGSERAKCVKLVGGSRLTGSLWETFQCATDRQPF